MRRTKMTLEQIKKAYTAFMEDATKEKALDLINLISGLPRNVQEVKMEPTDTLSRARKDLLLENTPLTCKDFVEYFPIMHRSNISKMARNDAQFRLQCTTYQIPNCKYTDMTLHVLPANVIRFFLDNGSTKIRNRIMRFNYFGLYD